MGKLVIDFGLKSSSLLSDISNLIEYVLENLGFGLCDAVHALKIDHALLNILRSLIVSSHFCSFLVHSIHQRVYKVMNHLSGFHLYAK